MGTNVTLTLISDTHSEEFRNFTGLVPRVGESVEYYSKKHDGMRYSGVVKNIHHRIEFKHQNDATLDTNQEIIVTITESKVNITRKPRY